MAPSKLEQSPPNGKRTTPHPAAPSKLLEDCKRCGRPVFWCRVETASGIAGNPRVAVHVLERRVGRWAIQATLGSDELVAVNVERSARTFYNLHVCRRRFFAGDRGAS